MKWNYLLSLRVHFHRNAEFEAIFWGSLKQIIPPPFTLLGNACPLAAAPSNAPMMPYSATCTHVVTPFHCEKILHLLPKSTTLPNTLVFDPSRTAVSHVQNTSALHPHVPHRQKETGQYPRPTIWIMPAMIQVQRIVT